MYNASERKEIRRAEKAAKQRETDRIDFVVGAMSTRQGRLWFHDMLAACHIFSDPFTGDALMEAYSKGERNMGLGIYRDLVSHCPDLFVRMMQEVNEKEIINDRASDTPDRTDESESDDPTAGDEYA